MKRPLLVLGGLLLLAIVTSWLRALAYPRTSGPMTHQVYVWQRQWTPAVSEAVSNLDPGLSPPVLLAVEARFSSSGGDAYSFADVPIDESVLAGKPYAMAVRMGGGNPSLIAPSAAANVVSGALFRRTQKPIEIHIDFDCPESQLDAYRNMAAEIRKRVAPIPVAITALPSWLDESAFSRLAADGPYILQVHSLHTPKTINGDWRIFDPAEAQQAVVKAGRIGAPFRVALPTYGHAIQIQKADPTKFYVSSEDVLDLDQAQFTTRWVRTDPTEVATLVREWTASRPAAMTGIMWYRLPVATDQLNWRMPTLKAVMAGRTPAATLLVTAKVDKGLVDLALVNTGDADAPLPAKVTIDWTGPAPLASDFLAGFQQLEQSPTSVTLSRSDADSEAPANRLAPGDRRAIGWLRFTTDTEVRGHVTSP